MYYTTSQVWNNSNVLKEIYYAQHGYIYLMKNTC